MLSKPECGRGAALRFFHELQVFHHVGGRVLLFLGAGQREEKRPITTAKNSFFMVSPW